MPADSPSVQKVALEPWEVGAELLDILSRGLYSDARDALREYVQNGVDAGATHILLTIDGPTVVIRDDGSGMDEALLRAARRFGMSQKSPREMVGYRGIGIYSAFGICEQMRILSRQSGMDQLVGWVFQFGEMRRVLETDKEADVRQGLGLANLLYQNTDLVSEPYQGDINDHFTVVRLEGVSEEYRAQLHDASKVNAYLLNTIPVAFPSRQYGPTVNEWLREHVRLNPVRISLRIANEPEFDVEPPLADDVFEPECDWIDAPDGSHLAFAWRALSTTGRQIPSQGNGYGVSGFLMKVRGFTLGDRLTLKPLWPALGGRTLYHHYTGELHVLESARVYPNAARDDLEPSPAKQVLCKQAGDFFESLSRQADLRRAMVRANRLTEGLEQIVTSLASRQEAPDHNPFELYREAKNHLAELETVQKELLKHVRPGPRRQPLKLNEEQHKELAAIDDSLRTAAQRLGTIVRAAQQRTRRAEEQAKPSREQPPPQISVLNTALSGLQAMALQSQDDRIPPALQNLESAVRLRSVPQAIAILDDLKAAGLQLSTAVETARKELRAFMGWSPLGPVSLEESLAQLGVSLETEREEAIIDAIDRGLIAALGGRGDRYEAVLRALAEALSDEFPT